MNEDFFDLKKYFEFIYGLVNYFSLGTHFIHAIIDDGQFYVEILIYFRKNRFASPKLNILEFVQQE